MKKIGVSYSPAIDEIWPKVKELADTVEICDLYRFEKASGKLWTYHFQFRDPYNPKSGLLNLLKLNEIKIALEKSKEVILRKKPQVISVHFGFSALEIRRVPPDNQIVAESSVLPKAEVLERFVESLDFLSEFSESINVPLAVENLDYYSSGAYEYVCEPEFINKVFERNKRIYLLLDIAHAEVSSVTLSKSGIRDRLEALQEYLGKLPLEKVVEIHINSPIWRNEIPFDVHLPMTKIEKRLLNELLLLPSLQVINLECETEAEKQLKYLRRRYS